MFAFVLVPILAGLASFAIQNPDVLPGKRRPAPHAQQPARPKQLVFSTRINERGQEVFIIKDAQAYRGQVRDITISKGTP